MLICYCRYATAASGRVTQKLWSPDQGKKMRPAQPLSVSHCMARSGMYALHHPFVYPTFQSIDVMLVRIRYQSRYVQMQEAASSLCLSWANLHCPRRSSAPAWPVNQSGIHLVVFCQVTQTDHPNMFSCRRGSFSYGDSRFKSWLFCIQQMSQSCCRILDDIVAVPFVWPCVKAHCLCCFNSLQAIVLC